MIRTITTRGRALFKKLPVHFPPQDSFSVAMPSPTGRDHLGAKSIFLRLWFKSSNWLLTYKFQIFNYKTYFTSAQLAISLYFSLYAVFQVTPQKVRKLYIFYEENKNECTVLQYSEYQTSLWLVYGCL